MQFSREIDARIGNSALTLRINQVHSRPVGQLDYLPVFFVHILQSAGEGWSYRSTVYLQSGFNEEIHFFIYISLTKIPLYINQRRDICQQVEHVWGVK
jgi:hypothetical protein